MSATTGFDAVLVLSFGGPDKPDDVRPFLENVTRGRGVPPERLDEVAEHYLHFGGVSPINALNKAMIAAVETELDRAGIDLPVYFGNRNWHPMVEDTLARIHADGHRRVLVFPTSAWGGYSGCRQYDEDIARALASLGSDAADMFVRKLPQYWQHPAMTASWADSIAAAKAQLPEELRDDARLVFTAHSIPLSADRAAGPPARRWAPVQPPGGGGVPAGRGGARASPSSIRCGNRGRGRLGSRGWNRISAITSRPSPPAASAR